MFLRFLSTFVPLAATLLVALAPIAAQAAFHLWQVKEAFTNHDGTVQFIELFNSNSGEQFVQNTTLRANSDGVIKNFTIPANLTVPAGQTTAGKHMLIATPGFAALTGGVTPNFTLPDPTVGGPFFNPNATSITISFLNSSDAITFAGATLPKNGLQSLTDANAFGFPANPTNIGVTTNSPTNFAGNAGQVNVPPPAPETTGDYNGNGVVDAADYTVWRDTFGDEVDEGTGADGMPDGMIDDEDYAFWKSRFGDVVDPPGSGSATSVVIPEPAVIAMTITGLLALLVTARRARKGSTWS
jgi:hypothetical protein